jgi:hypothetical protein
MKKSFANTIPLLLSPICLTALLFAPATRGFSGDFLVTNIFVDASTSQDGDGPLKDSNYIYCKHLHEAHGHTQNVG